MFYLYRNIYKNSASGLVLFFIILGLAPLHAIPYRIGVGFGYNGSYFNQDYMAPLAVGTKGAIEQEISVRNAKEQRAQRAGGGVSSPISDLTFEEGGCPDTAIIQEEPIDLSDVSAGAQINPQVIRIYGRSCAVSSASGTGLSLTALELDFVAEYDLKEWLFVRTGFTFGLVIPVQHTLGMQFGGELRDVAVAGLTASGISVPTIGAEVQVNSKATLRFSGYHLQIPITVGVDLYEDEETSFYFGGGLMFSHAAFYRRTTAQQRIQVLTSTADQAISLGDTYYRGVTNVDEIPFTIGLLYFAGARRAIDKQTSVYVEFRWLTSGSIEIETKGTKREAGNDYANDTLAAQVFENAFPGSTAKALRGAGAPDGARTANGLNLSYTMRLTVGMISTFDY